MENKYFKKPNIHKVLAHSYAVYLILFLVSICLDFVFRIKILSSPVMIEIGFFVLILATLLILWAQKTSHDLRKIQEVKMEHFCRGPYCYTRSPTHWGLFFLMLGFGIIANAFFTIICTIIAFLITRFIFLDKEEKMLEQKYGAPYIEYKKKVQL